jgi:hypothetical protein
MLQTENVIRFMMLQKVNIDRPIDKDLISSKPM